MADGVAAQWVHSNARAHQTLVVSLPGDQGAGGVDALPVLPLNVRHAAGFQRDDIAARLFTAALAGGREVMRYWRRPVPVDTKADGSQVSLADHAADAAIRAALAEAGIDTPIVSEESAPSADPDSDTFLLVDPLDGTAEFLEGGTEFCICIGLVKGETAVAGAIVAPAMGCGWWGGETAMAVTLDKAQSITGRSVVHHSLRPRDDRMIALVSRKHGDAASSAAAAKLCGVHTRPSSSAIKYGLLADGAAHVHLRNGPTMAWDICAGDAILNAAGGAVRDHRGAALRYRTAAAGYLNPPLVAVADAALLPRALAAVQRAS